MKTFYIVKRITQIFFLVRRYTQIKRIKADFIVTRIPQISTDIHGWIFNRMRMKRTRRILAD